METTPNTPAPTTTRMTRPLEGRMIAGVSAAFAERLDVDVNIIRIFFVLTSFFGGFGLVAYAASWVLLPDEGETRSPAQRWFGKE